jgi:hypothetical protein
MRRTLSRHARYPTKKSEESKRLVYRRRLDLAGLGSGNPLFDFLFYDA